MVIDREQSCDMDTQLLNGNIVQNTQDCNLKWFCNRSYMFVLNKAV
jgi:hypothetical protein